MAKAHKKQKHKNVQSESVSSSFGFNTLEGVVTQLPVNDDTSYCYACLGRIEGGQEEVVGFSATFDGLQKVANLFIDAFTMLRNVGLHYAGFIRCSSRQMAEFIQKQINQNNTSILVTYGIFYEGEISVIITPQNIVMHERDPK